MKFDGNLAWQQGIAAIGANRSLLLPVAGVFFLLPALASYWFMADIQNAIMQNVGNREAMEQAMANAGGGTWLLILLANLLQITGFMALLALLTDQRRPTVGQAIGVALKSLPSAIAAWILAILALSLIGGLLIGLVAALGATTGSGAAIGGGVLMVVVSMIGFVYVMTKLSMTLPVIVIERVANPVGALVRSWRLTTGNSLRLFGFYLLLLIGYLVISTLVALVVAAFVGFETLASGGAAGSVGTIFAGVISGVVGAMVSLIFTGILAAIHRQLAGPSAGAIADTFA